MKNIIFITIKLFFALLFCILFYRAYVLSPKISLEPIIDSSILENPVHLAAYPNNKDKFLVSEKTGKVKLIDVKAKKAEVLLDLSDRTYLGHLEAGLLSSVFDPDFKNNKNIFVFYSVDEPVRARVSRFTLDENNKAILSSEIVIVEWNKVQPHHYGGCVYFGEDSYLYISVGEDVQGSSPIASKLRGQTFRGSILRLDVSESSKKKPYKIPSNNPYVDHESFLPEIWAFGFRNPWRFHYDSKTQKIIVGDTGEHKREEYNFLSKSGDYGWPEYEGEICHLSKCNKGKTLDPFLSLTHAVVRTAVPGYFYEGESVPSLNNTFFFADYVRGLFAVDSNTDEVMSPIDFIFSPSLTPIYYKMPIRQGRNKGKKHGIASLHKFGDKYYVVDMHSTIYTIEKLKVEDSFFGFLYHFLKF